MIAIKQPVITVRVWRGGSKGAKGTKDAESAKDVALNGGCEGDESGGGELQAFQIPFAEGDTVLTALLYIYENLDSTLAFRHGCRAGRCGLCAVEVNGKPRPACKTPVGPVSSGMIIRPLSRLPVLRDLVIDRRRFFGQIGKHRLYLFARSTDLSPKLLQQPLVVPSSSPLIQVIQEPAEHRYLVACTECLCCLAACPRYHYEDPSFGGPYLFVKLAQLHFDPRDAVDRRKQAWELGIGECEGCGKCYCPNGVDIFKKAIGPLSSPSV